MESIIQLFSSAKALTLVRSGCWSVRYTVNDGRNPQDVSHAVLLLAKELPGRWLDVKCVGRNIIVYDVSRYLDLKWAKIWKNDLYPV